MRGTISQFAALMVVSGAASACPGLSVEDAWIREAPPGATVMAAYAKLHNSSDQTLILDKVSSSAFSGAEVHRTVVEDGVSRMLRGQTLTLAPGAGTDLAPGGWHLMLFQPHASLKAGDRVAVSLSCGKAAQTHFFTVRRP